MKKKMKNIQIFVLALGLTSQACKPQASKPQNVLSMPHSSQKSHDLADVTREISQGKTFLEVLMDEGFNAHQAHVLIDAARTKLDLRRIKSGARVGFHYLSDGCCESRNIEKISLELPEGKSLELLRSKTLVDTADQRNEFTDSWNSTITSLPVETRLVRFATTLSSPSLWQSAEETGIDLIALSRFTELFSWDIDFAREVKPGASLSFFIQEKIVNGRRLDWGNIIAASFFTGERLVQAVYYEGSPTHSGGYYRPDGQSLKRMFLKSPVDSSRVTSGFSFARFHPILKDSRPHLGVDYAAPAGTSVRTIGDGIVTESNYREGAGNFVRIRHNGVYETAYKHLSKFSNLAIPGSNVKQGEVIGFVGSTGLATGPHLHFELYRHGQYVDPLSEDFPSVEPLNGSDLAIFLPLAKQRLMKLSDEKEKLLAKK